MNYKVPIFEINGEIEESLNNIEKVIKDLNIRRDQSLSENLSEKINLPITSNKVKSVKLLLLDSIINLSEAGIG